MIRFSLFGIPVEIQPFFWVTTALLGGALGARTPETILAMLLFVAAAFVSILIHELGHALTGLRHGGGRAEIQLNAFGGLAISHNCFLDRRQRLQMIAAGPGAGFAFLIVIIGALCLPFHDGDVLAFCGRVLFGLRMDYSTPDLGIFMGKNLVVMLLVTHLLWINFWWGVLNLLPVMPLDGGQIAALLLSPRTKVYQVGMVAAGAMAALAWFWLHSEYTAILFGFLAWQNYQNMRSSGWR